MSFAESLKCYFGKATGGVHAPHRKYTATLETVEMPAPALLTIPMSQHLGAPCVPTVAVGDHVLKGQVIGDSDKPVSAPIHSGVSGTVKAITEIVLPGGRTSQAVVIENDGENTLCEGIEPPVVENHADFIKAVRASGLVGLGGAGFPTHIKLNPKNLDEIDTIIINAAECEPYLTADYRECMEHPWDILSGVQAVLEYLDAKRAIVAIEKNKPQAIAELSRIAQTVSTTGREILVKGLPAQYPQGAEKVIIAACTGRRVPAGKLPADVGCVVMNVTSVSFLARYLKTGMPLMSKRVTVDGSSVAHPKNLRVIIGTSAKDVFEFAGGLKDEPKKLIMGGPMMGQVMLSDEVPVIKNTNGLLALSEEDVKLIAPSACIRCGKCVSVCPMHLMPPSVARALERRHVEAMERLGVMSCMECGCCAYSCPAHRPIAQTMRLAKDVMRNAASK